jgi:hypothetical protein
VVARVGRLPRPTSPSARSSVAVVTATPRGIGRSRRTHGGRLPVRRPSHLLTDGFVSVHRGCRTVSRCSHV